MRTFASLGTAFFLVGLFFFTRGLAGHLGSMIFGAVLGLIGLFIVGAVAANPECDESTRSDSDASLAAPRNPTSNRRVRRRSSTDIRSLRVRRTVIEAAGGR